VSQYNCTFSSDLAQLSSIKVLQLIVRLDLYEWLESRHWQRIFPQVQVVNVAHTNTVPCICCTKFKGHLTEEERFEECEKQLLKTFQQLTALRRLIVNDACRPVF